MSEQIYQATEPATSFRRRQARKAGYLLRSAEVNAVLVLLAGLLMVATLCPAIYTSLSSFTRQMLSSPLPTGPQAPAPADYAANMISRSAWQFILAAAPSCLLLAAALLFGGLLQSGFYFSTQPLEFKLERLSLGAGLSRMFQLRAAVRLAYHLIKLVLVGFVAFLGIRSALPHLLSLTSAPPELLLGDVGRIILRFGLNLILLLACLAGLDYLLAGYFLKRDLRMSPEELRQEQRDTEGISLIRRRWTVNMPSPAALAAAVLQADFVLIDSAISRESGSPQLAVALKCGCFRTKALNRGPVRLLAKGSGALARQIHLLAAQRSLPLFVRPNLTVALARAVPVNHYVPLRLYPELTELLQHFDPTVQFVPDSSAAASRPGWDRQQYVDDLQIPTPVMD